MAQAQVIYRSKRGVFRDSAPGVLRGTRPASCYDSPGFSAIGAHSAAAADEIADCLDDQVRLVEVDVVPGFLGPDVLAVG